VRKDEEFRRGYASLVPKRLNIIESPSSVEHVTITFLDHGSYGVVPFPHVVLSVDEQVYKIPV
jgi:hypothetical protein